MTPRCAAAVAVAILVLAPAPAAPGAAAVLVAVGEVTPASAVIWVRGVAPGRVTVDVADAVGPLARRVEALVGAETDLTVKLPIDGLRPATRYAYRVASGGETATGEFATAPAPDVAAPLTLLWSGDLGGGGACRRADRGYRIFTPMARRRADFFLFLGDTIYADHRCAGPGVAPGADVVATTLAEYRAKHRDNREDAAAAAFYRRVPVFAIWDDHEVRNDFSGPTEALMPIGRRAFLDYWPLTPPAEDPTRLYRRFAWGRLVEVFILDTSTAAPTRSPTAPARPCWGARSATGSWTR